MFSGIISYPGQMAWEWTKAHPSRFEIEASQVATIFFSGCLGFHFPQTSTLAISSTILLSGGAIYGMYNEPSMDFDGDVRAKKLAFEVMRLTFGVFFGFCLGATIQNVRNLEKIIFPSPIIIENPSYTDFVMLPFQVGYQFTMFFSRLLPVTMYPIITGLTWFSEPKPYKGQ